MKHLIDKKKFLEELDLNNSPGGVIYVHDVKCDMPGRILDALSNHLQDIKDEPHHPSGMNHHDINVRNALRKELRGE